MKIQARHIEAFLAVAAEASFARAAARLHVSQPALSQTILQFEGILGFAVFGRTTRTVNLTPEGERLLWHAKTVQAAFQDLQAEAERMAQRVKNELRVGYMIGTAVEYIPQIVREFERRRPNAMLQLQEYDFTDPSAGLARGEVHCAIVRPPLGIEGLSFVEVARERCVACLPSGHRFAGEATVSITDLVDEPIVAAPLKGVWRDYWLALDYRGGRPPNVTFEVATVESELRAVASGRGISITAQSTASYYARPGVVFVPISDMAECTIAVAHAGPLSRIGAEFVSVVREVCGNIG